MSKRKKLTQKEILLMLTEVVRQIAVEQGTRDHSGIDWATQQLNTLNEINEGIHALKGKP